MRFFTLSTLAALASLAVVVSAQEDPSASDVATSTTSLTTDPSLSTGLTDPSGTLSGASESATAQASSSSSVSGTRKSTKTSSGASSTPTDSSTDSIPAATIPSGISSGCSGFMNTLNTDSGLSKCLSPYYAATSAFGSASGDKSAVTSALNNLCSASGCATTIRTLLTAFYSACPDELTGANPNADVKKFYDDLYIIYPMRQTLCAKDSGSYCALKSASSNAAQVSDYKQSVLSGGDGISSFSKDGVPYLFASPSMSSDELCTPCNQAILGYYAGWESSTPYAYGLLNSPTLSGQKDLLASVNSQCGSTYLQVIKNNAEDNASNDAVSSRGTVMGGMTTLLVGAIGAWIML